MFIKYNNERVYYHPNPIIRYVEQKRANTVLNLLKPIKKADYILAAGCGEGYIEKQIKSGKILLVDISPEAIKRARDKIKPSKNRKFLKADLEKLPVKGKTFDKIECSEVIEHVLNPNKMLKEFHRVLKDDGILVISFPNEPLINSLKKFFVLTKTFKLFFPNIPNNMTEEWHLRSMEIKSFKKMSSKHWNLTKTKRVPFSFLPIRYVVCCTKIN